MHFPAVGVDPAGNFVVAWELFEYNAGLFGIFARRFSSSGAALGSPFRVNTQAAGSYFVPRVAAWTGGFVVVWGNEAPGNVQDAYGQRYATAGSPVGSEFRVNNYTSGSQGTPDVAARADGSFVICWDGASSDDSLGVHARRYDATGAPQGLGFRVNTYTTGLQSQPRIAADIFGNFVVVWRSTDQDGSGHGVFGQRLSGGGARLGTEFRVNSNPVGDQAYASVAAAKEPDYFLVTFTSPTGTDENVWARAYCLVGDANGDGSVNVSDVFYLINTLFAGGSAPGCADVNADTHIDVADVFYLINYLFAAGPPPV